MPWLRSVSLRPSDQGASGRRVYIYIYREFGAHVNLAINQPCQIRNIGESFGGGTRRTHAPFHVIVPFLQEVGIHATNANNARLCDAST